MRRKIGHVTPYETSGAMTKIESNNEEAEKEKETGPLLPPLFSLNKLSTMLRKNNKKSKKGFQSNYCADM